MKYTLKAYISVLILILLYYIIEFHEEIKGFVPSGCVLITLIFTYYIISKNYNRLLIRVMLTLPLVIIIRILEMQFKVPFLISLSLVIIPLDICTIISWRYHILSILLQFIVINYLNSEEELKISELLISYEIIVIYIIFTTFVFAVIEKLLKEYWVIRETSEKSFRVFLSIMRDCQEAKVIIDESLNIKFQNRKFEEIMKKLINNSFPNSMKETIHENSFDKFKETIHLCIKKQEPTNSTVILSYKSKNTQETYEFSIRPLLWKGTKAVIICLNSIEDKIIKHRLLLNQATDICSQFDEYIRILEDELAMNDNQSSSSLNLPNSAYVTKLLLIISKIYNDFLFIKNVFEMDCNDLRVERECFLLKQYFLYSVDLLLSLKQKSKVDISVDPCLPEEVDGDLTKFRQIVTSILDFSLKSTGEVKVQLRANFVLKAGNYSIDFKIFFTPKFEITQEELDLLFGSKDDLFMNHSKLDKEVGLSIHVLGKLVCFLGGGFNKYIKNLDGSVNLEFSLPFEALKTMNFAPVNTPKIKGNAKRSVINGNIVISSPISGFRKPSMPLSSKSHSKHSRILSIRESIKNSSSIVGEELSNIDDKNDNFLNPGSREGETFQIKVGKLSDMTALSAAPSVIKQEEAKSENSIPQISFRNFKEKKSLVVSTNIDKKKSNFASAKYQDQSVSGESNSGGSSYEFDYSKYVLEDKSLLLKQDAGNTPISVSALGKRNPIVHPRIKKIEAEERFSVKNKRKSSKDHSSDSKDNPKLPELDVNKGSCTEESIKLENIDSLNSFGKVYKLVDGNAFDAILINQSDRCIQALQKTNSMSNNTSDFQISEARSLKVILRNTKDLGNASEIRLPNSDVKESIEITFKNSSYLCFDEDIRGITSEFENDAIQGIKAPYYYQTTKCNK